MLRPLLLLAGLAALPSFALPNPAHAQAFISGRQLAGACASRAPNDERSCDGYVAGALDVIAEAPELKGKVCPPDNMKLGAVREMVGRFGQQHPDDARGSGVALVVAAVRANHPCGS